MKQNFRWAKQPVILMATIVAAVFLTTSRTSAQQVLGTAIGPKIGFYLDGGNFMVGAIAEFPLTANIDIEPGLEYILGIQSITRVVVDVNIRYSFLLQGLTVKPFVLGGGGVQFDKYTTNFADQKSSNTEILLNLGAGATFNTRSRLQPWGGLKFSFLGGGLAGGAVLQGGVNFYL
jgi:hypothetical protein